MEKIKFEFSPQECLDYSRILRAKPGELNGPDSVRLKLLSRLFISSLQKQASREELQKLIVK